MNKAIRFQWAPRSSRPDAQVVLVQEGRLLAPPSLPPADRLALENWIGTTKFKGKVGAAAWPQGLPSPMLALGITARARLPHSANASSPMAVTPPGITTSVRLPQR